jgi:cytochrome P450
MPLAPTTSLDLTDPSFVRDPYPWFARERDRHGVAWHEASQRYLLFSHAAVSAAQRDRRLGRIWKPWQPESYLEPFNLLHRNQMMENEPPDHGRLRRPVAAAFNRGHVERLRPRVGEIAAGLLAEVTVADFDLIAEYAEPLPVLVIAELLGVPVELAPQLRDWSQAMVKMYEQEPPSEVIDAAVQAAVDFAAYVRVLVAERRAAPRTDLISDLAASELAEDEIVASVVLLLNAGHEASVNVFGNGLVGMLQAGVVPGEHLETCVEEMLRFDSALQLFERTAIEPVVLDGVELRPGDRIASLLGSANRDPAVFTDPDQFLVTRSPNPHVALGVGVHFCLGAPLARMELVESLALLFRELPELTLREEPESRGTFVLRGYRSVRVGG